MNLTNNAQNLDFPGWKAFDNNRNRYAIIADYLDGGMQPFRQFQYDYYRKGTRRDGQQCRSEDVRRSRPPWRQNLKKAKENKPLSLLATDLDRLQERRSSPTSTRARAQQRRRRAIYRSPLLTINPNSMEVLKFRMSKPLKQSRK